MSRRRRLLVAVLIVLSMVLPLAASGAAVADGHGGQEGPNSSNYSLSELQNCGKSYESAPDSMRFVGDYGSATVRYFPVGPGGSNWNYLERGTTVNGDRVAIRTVRLAPPGELDETLNVTTVFWQKGQRTVEEGNTTTTVTVAKNVTSKTTQIEAGRGYALSNISLPPHYDQTWQVTMFIEENPDARWCFEHQSVESSRGLPFPATWGGLWSWITPTMLLPILLSTGFVAMAVPASIKRTGQGPNMGLLFWFIVLGVLGMIVGGGAYVWTTSVLASAPYVVAVLIAGVIGIIMLETMEYGLYRVAFIRLFTEDKQNPRGDVAAEARGGEFEVATVADTDDGPKAIEDGIRPWLARLFSGGSPLYGVERLELEFDLGSPTLSLTHSPASKLIFIDEDADQLLNYEPESLVLDLPLTQTNEDGDDHIDWGGVMAVLSVGALGGAVTYGAFNAAGIGGATPASIVGAVGLVMLLYTRAEPGHATFLPAVGAAADATATAMYRDSELDNYETLEAALSELVDERNSKDELLDQLEELDTESAVKQASSRDTSPGDFADAPTSEADD